jgi:hypothetical protein
MISHYITQYESYLSFCRYLYATSYVWDKQLGEFVAIESTVYQRRIAIDWIVASKTNSESIKLINVLKTSCYLIMKKNPVQRRIVHSCPSLKVKIGSVGFATRITPAFVLSFCVEQTISILLL